MIDAARMYVNYVQERQKELQAEMLVEHQFDCHEINENIWGTADMTLIGEDRLVIIDLKAGRYPVENNGNNLQLRIYGLMALARYSDKKYVEMVVVQPRANHKDGPIRSSTLKSEDLAHWGFEWLKPAAEKCLEENPEFVAGKHCFFCNYKPECEEHANYKKQSEVNNEQ
tara:strand:+ start:1193 stop:1702 length:510 start_codon:yes stop_codon:yes gene_type:complete